MRINDVNYGLYNYQSQIKQNKTNTSKSQNTDSVSISSKGLEIADAMKSGQTDRQKKIQELKQQISNGTYQVDSQKIAGRMLDFWNK